MKTKSPPQSKETLRDHPGIIFSLHLSPRKLLTDPNSSLYDLDASIKTIDSISLMRRINGRIIKEEKVVTKASRGRKAGVIMAANQGQCVWCKTVKTAQWRKGLIVDNVGPSGARGLCNRCGIEWAKNIRYEALKSHSTKEVAESVLIKDFKLGIRFQRYIAFNARFRRCPSEFTDPNDNSD